MAARPWAGLAAVALLASCGGGGRPNLLLLSVDTLRADRLGAFGYGRPTSPALDRFAAQAVVFERAVAQAPWTLPSVASLMSGLVTTTHGCWTPRTKLDVGVRTLAEELTRGGYDTLAVANQPYLARQHGLGQGFVHYDDELTLNSPEITSELVSDKLIRWLGLKRAKTDEYPWFIWGHYFDPHENYLLHEGVSEQFGTEDNSDVYDGEVRYTDLHMGRVLDALDELGLADSTVVVVVTDHGEEFGDHGGAGHGQTLYEEVTRMPLMVRVPGVAPRRVAEPVAAIDVMPTLLELARLPAPPEVQGTSLLPFLDGSQVPDRPALSEVRRAGSHFQRSLTWRGWKLIVDFEEGAEHLFDLTGDPGETQDLAAERPDKVAVYRRELQRLVERAQADAERHGFSAELALSPEEVERLEQLGYAAAPEDVEEPEEHE